MDRVNRLQNLVEMRVQLGGTFHGSSSVSTATAVCGSRFARWKMLAPPQPMSRAKRMARTLSSGPASPSLAYELLLLSILVVQVSSKEWTSEWPG